MAGPASITESPVESATESLGQQVRSAVIWRSGSQIAAQLVAWASTFLVIRILSPADYGLFAMAQVMLTFLNMLNGYGLASAIIQRPEVSDCQVRQLFGMLLVLNGTLAAAQFLTAPLVASYFRQPIVADLLRVLALPYLFTPFIALPFALLGRAMDFRKQAQANMISAVAGAVAAIGGALGGLGVWTLVLAPTVLFAVRALAMTIAADSWMRPSFDFRGAGDITRFGAVMAASQLFWFLQSQADVFIAGRYLDPHWLGIYTTGLFLTQIFVSKFVPALNEVAFSAYARIQHDRAAVASAFVRAAGIIMVAAMPFYIGLAVTAEPLVLTVLGAKWAETAPVIRILALAMPFMTLLVLYTPACDASGRPGVGVRNGAIGAVTLTAAFLVGVRWGVTGLALAWVAAYPLYFLIASWRALPVIGAGAADLSRAVAPPVIAALAMGLVVMAVDRVLPAMSPASHLASLVAVGAATYAGWMLLFARRVVCELIAIMSKRPLPTT